MRALAGVLFLGGLLAVTSLSSAQPPGGKGGQPPGKRGDKGDKGGKGFPGGKGGTGGFGGVFGPSLPGQIMPAALAERLKLNDDQMKQLETLQKDIDEKLAKILTEDQNKQLKEMKDRGRGGAGGFGRPGSVRPGGDKGGNPPPPPGSR